MASQWIRWNQITHIFEYSTDNGSSFNPLPLNAATITEGAIPDAVLSPNVVMENIANVMTSALPFSIESAAPTIQFKETDQPADGRFWRENFQGGAYRLQSLTDALGATDLLTIDRTGLLNLSQNVEHIFGGAVGGILSRIRVRNTVSGVDRAAGFALETDIGLLGAFNAFTSGYTSIGSNIASGINLVSTGAGGISISATHVSGAIRLYSGASNVIRLNITAAGDTILSGSLTERGRATPVGEWITVPYNAADFTTSTAATWGVDAADLRTFKYMLLGKTLFIIFTFITTSVGTPAPVDLRFKIPGGFICASQVSSFAHLFDGTWQQGDCLVPAGSNYVAIQKISLSTTFTASAVNNIYAYGTVILEVQ